MTTPYGVVLVHTSAAAIRAEKLLHQAGLTVKLIPVPRQFSSDCGLAVRFPWEARETVERTLHEGRLEIAAIHRL